MKKKQYPVVIRRGNERYAVIEGTHILAALKMNHCRGNGKSKYF